MIHDLLGLRVLWMVVVSASRLQVRKRSYLLRLFLANWVIGRELRRATGFLGGRLVLEKNGTMWTCTIWEDLGSMKRFRNAGHHLRAMRDHLGILEEVAHGHWEEQEAPNPSWPEVHRRLLENALFTKLKHPSAFQSEGALALFDPEQVLIERIYRPRDTD
jgi:hypothetical protein